VGEEGRSVMMSAITGLLPGSLKGGSASNTPKAFTGIQIQTSTQGVPISIIYGKSKQSGNIIWAGDFTKTAIKGGKGGKGLGGAGKGKGGQTYDYKTAGIIALCEGQIGSIDQVWANGQLTTLSKLGLTLFTGSAGQSVWSYLSMNHPSEALAYSSTAYLAAEAYDLGQSAALPNHEFEIVGKLSGTMPGTVDINYADAISDLVTNTQYSLGPLTLDSTSLAFYKTYCQAQGLFFSPAINQSSQSISDVINGWAALSNTWVFWSEGTTKFVPLGDVAITANSVTYTPNLTIQYALTSADFICDPGAVPITVDQADPSDLPNHVKLEVLDRDNSYNIANVEWQDQALVDQFGRVDANVQSAHDICELAVANIVKMLVGQRAAYVRNKYAFTLGYEKSLLEPGDLCSILDANSGIPSAKTVRIVSMDEDENDNWAVTAEDFILGVGSVSATTENGNDGFSVDLLADPGNVNFPMILEPTADLTNGVPQLWLALSGGEEWGGATIMCSFDGGTNYSAIGIIAAPAWQGGLTGTLASHADPDTLNTLSIDTTTSVSVLDTTATHDDADKLRTLALLGDISTPGLIPNDPELIAYGSVSLTGTYLYDLTYLRRGAYGSTISSHAIGTNFTRFDIPNDNSPLNTVFIYNLPPQYIAATLYFKFPSFNKFGNAIQDISTLDPFTYTTTGRGFGSAPQGPGRRTITIDGVTVTSPYTMKNRDRTLTVKNTSGADMVILAPPNPTNGQKIVVKYKSDNAGTHTLTLKDNAAAVTLDEIVAIGGRTIPMVWNKDDSEWDANE
jgi:hypothetical protein